MPKSRKLHFAINFLPVFIFLLGFDSCANASQQPIKAVVVLILENRSFDHMLGWMKKSVNPSIDGLTGAECNPRSTVDPRSPLVCVSDNAQFVDPDPGHSFDAVKDQVYGSASVPTMSGFVQQAQTVSPDLADTVMKGFTPENLPVFAALVQEFAVFDRWFSSLPGPTQPNRLFVYSATSHGAISHNKKDLVKGYPQKTIFDSLHEEGFDFGVYFESAPTTLFYRNLRKLKYVFKFHKYGTFEDHARDGRLRSLSVIEPRYFDIRGSPANDDHPSHDVANGQRLVKEVYESLRASPQWNESLLVITYDEHGGFYDHVVTPYVGVPTPDGIVGPEPEFYGFDRLGVRVPAIMVSPWIKKGTVVSRPTGPTATSEYEHSSIPATIKKMFRLRSDFLTARDAWAGAFEGVVSQLTSPRTDCPEFLPDVPTLRKAEVKENKTLSEFQNEIVQLASVLSGDHFLSSFDRHISEKMTVKEANRYVKQAVTRFVKASREAMNMGADDSAIVDMRASLTSRIPHP